MPTFSLFSEFFSGFVAWTGGDVANVWLGVTGVKNVLAVELEIFGVPCMLWWPPLNGRKGLRGVITAGSYSDSGSSFAFFMQSTNHSTVTILIFGRCCKAASNFFYKTKREEIQGNTTHCVIKFLCKNITECSGFVEYFSQDFSTKCSINYPNSTTVLRAYGIRNNEFKYFINVNTKFFFFSWTWYSLS